MKEKLKLPLSEDEKVILRSIDPIYKWIARDEDGGLCCYEEKPFKNRNVYIISKGNHISLDGFSHLFKLIKWIDFEPRLIEDLLK